MQLVKNEIATDPILKADVDLLIGLGLEHVLNRYKPGMGQQSYAQSAKMIKEIYHQQYAQQETQVSDFTMYVRQIKMLHIIHQKIQQDKQQQADRNIRIINAFVKQQFTAPVLDQTSKVFAQIPGTNVSSHVDQINELNTKANSLKQSILAGPRNISLGDSTLLAQQIQSIQKEADQLKKKSYDLKPNEKSVDLAYTTAIQRKDNTLLKDLAQTGKKPSMNVVSKIDDYMKRNFKGEQSTGILNRLGFSQKQIENVVKFANNITKLLNPAKYFADKKPVSAQAVKPVKTKEENLQWNKVVSQIKQASQKESTLKQTKEQPVEIKPDKTIQLTAEKNLQPAVSKDAINKKAQSETISKTATPKLAKSSPVQDLKSDMNLIAKKFNLKIDWNATLSQPLLDTPALSKTKTISR